MNQEKPKTPAEAAQMVARLKSLFHRPYTLRAYIASGTLAADADPGKFLSQFSTPPPDIAGQTFDNFTELLRVWREFWPVGDWLFLLGGSTPGRQNPVAFIDTPIIEKAIAHHTGEGHSGTI